MSVKIKVIISIDVTNKKKSKIFSEINSIVGSYHVLISNAGVSSMNKIEDLTEDEWDYNFNVNTKGVFLTNQEAIIHFKNKIEGRIVNAVFSSKSWCSIIITLFGK